MADPIFTKEELERRALKLKSLHGVAQEILESTIQFYFDNAKPKRHAAGSGVLLNIDERYFILTAAHVFSEQHEKLYLVASEEVISEYMFIKLTDIDLGHSVDGQSRYLSVGYPLTKTKKIWGKNQLKSQPFAAVLLPSLNFNYEKFGFSFNTHIAIEYNNEVVSEKNQNPHLSPSLEGISGSGLWYLPDFLNKESNYVKKLIGITIEQVNAPTNRPIIATRIDLITEFLRQHLFLHNIPRSKAIKINLK